MERPKNLKCLLRENSFEAENTIKEYISELENNLKEINEIILATCMTWTPGDSTVLMPESDLYKIKELSKINI